MGIWKLKSVFGDPVVPTCAQQQLHFQQPHSVSPTALATECPLLAHTKPYSRDTKSLPLHVCPPSFRAGTAQRTLPDHQPKPLSSRTILSVYSGGWSINDSFYMYLKETYSLPTHARLHWTSPAKALRQKTNVILWRLAILISNPQSCLWCPEAVCKY